MEQTLSRYGCNAETADHKQREEQQLLLCSSSHENGAVVCVYISISSKQWSSLPQAFVSLFLTWVPLLQFQKDESTKSELERLQLAIEYVSLWLKLCVSFFLLFILVHLLYLFMRAGD